jgi:adenosylhomocysteine nucleosidase
MRILVTYAVQGEFTELKFPGLIGEEEVQIGYLRTGVGKVKSAFYLSEAISHAQPDLVVNVGTAGTIRHQVGDIFVCRHFVDRDMQKLVELGMEHEIDSTDLLSQKGYCLHWLAGGVCNTGDTFLTASANNILFGTVICRSWWSLVWSMRLIQWICCPKKDIVYTGRQAVYAIRGILS